MHNENDATPARVHRPCSTDSQVVGLFEVLPIPDGGYRIQLQRENNRKWIWWVYPDDRQISNNGPRYTQKGERTGSFLDLPVNWTLNDFFKSALAKLDRVRNYTGWQEALDNPSNAKITGPGETK